jgi:ankyrin repeat protein
MAAISTQFHDGEIVKAILHMDCKFDDVIDLQQTILDITPQTLDAVKESLLDSKWIRSTEGCDRIATAIIVAAHHRTAQIPVFAALATSLANAGRARLCRMKPYMLHCFFRSVGYAKPFPRESAVCSLMWHCFKEGLFELEDIFWRLRFITRGTHFLRPATWFFCYLGPEIQAFDARVYGRFKEKMKSLMERRSFPTAFKAFIENWDNLAAHDWAIQRKRRNFFSHRNTLITRILNDDVEFLRRASQSPGFSTETRILRTVFIPSSYLSNSPTLIQVAAFFGAIKCFNLLLSLGAELRAVDHSNRTVPHFAIAGGNIEIIRLCQQHDLDFIGALHVAIRFHRNEFFDWLYATQFPDPGERDFDGMTPLHVACESNNLYAAARLIDSGADVNSETYSRETPMRMAGRRGFIDSCRLLLAHPDCEADRPARSCVTPLHIAAKFGDLRIAQLLVDRGANISAATTDGANAFMVACASRHEKVAAYFMGLDALDINGRDAQGATGLVKAVEANHRKLAEALIRDGRVDVNQRQPFGTAVDQDMWPIAAALLARPDLDLRPRARGRTYLHRAIRGGNEELVAAILDRHVIDVNAQTADGKTALHLACEIGAAGIVALLLDQPDLDPNRIDAAGRTPLQTATRFPAVALMLIGKPTVDVNTGAPVHDLITANALRCIAALCSRQDFDVNALRNGITPLETAVTERRTRAMAFLMTRNEVDTKAAMGIAKKADFRGAVKMLKMRTGKQLFAYFKAAKIRKRKKPSTDCRGTA